MSEIYRFRKTAQNEGAALLYAPELATDPLQNLGNLTLPNGTLKNGAKLVTPGLIEGGAAAELDGTNDYVDTGWKTRTNLVLNPNPSPAHGIVGWSASLGAGAISASAEQAKFADGSMKQAAAVERDIMAVQHSGGPNNLKGVASSFGAWVYFTSPGTYRLEVYDGAAWNPAGAYAALGVGWNYLTLENLTPPTEAGLQYIVRKSVNWSAGEAIYWGGFMGVRGATVGSYFPTPAQLEPFDPAKPESGLAGWSGTAHESASDIGPFARGTARTFVGMANRTNSITGDALFGAQDAEATLQLLGGAATVRYNGGADFEDWSSAWPGNAQNVFGALTITSSTKRELFIDGVSKGVQTVGVSPPADSGNLLIGARLGAGSPFGGSMLPFAAFLGALTASQIELLYNATQPLPKRPRRKPPLDLDIEVETPDGVFRLPADSRKASDRPGGLSFSTQRGDGFGPGHAQLSRQIFKDWHDIGLLDTWRMVGRQGDIAYEGRLHSNPRTNDPRQQIDLSLVGWMTYLKSRKIAPLIVDRRFSGWGEASSARRAVLLGLGRTLTGHYSTSSEFDGVKFDGESGQQIPSGAMAELVYDAGDSNGIAKLMYRGTQQNTTNVQAASLFSDDVPAMDSALSTALTLDDSLRTATPAEALQYAGLQAFATATHTPAAGSPFARTLKYLALYGNHGLTTRSMSGEPDGVYLTDIIEYILSAFYPKLSWAGQENTFPVAQATWHDNPAFGYEVARQLNDLVLWEMNVWEERKLHFEAADLTKYDWQIRTDDPGVSVQFEGASIEEFANGVEVAYTDFYGTNHVLYPPDHDELRDDSESNPANRHGENLWADTSVPWRATEAEALQFGRARLAVLNRPKRPGTYRISGGYVKDGAGHWQPGWKVRSSQTVGILDHPAEEPRLIYATNWDQESLTLTIHTDGLPQTLDAVIGRHELALQARNLT